MNESAEAQRHPHSNSSREEGPCSEDGATRVLFVDDDADYVAAMLPVLSRCFAEVVHASSGREAWEKLKGGDFGLAIVDVLMEEPSSGLKLCRRIRADAKLRTMPVLVLSAVDERFSFGLKEHLGSDGFLPADEFLDKSRSPEEVAARARAVCARGHVVEEEGRAEDGEEAKSESEED